MANYTGHTSSSIVALDDINPISPKVGFYDPNSLGSSIPSDVEYGSIVENRPVIESPRNFSGHTATSFSSIFYNRILVEPLSIDVGNVISKQSYTIKIFNAFINDTADLNGIQESNTDGITIAGPLRRS